MARAGRKRKPVERTPAGRPSRAGAENEAAPTAIKRLRDNALRGVSGPEWGTELGRLFLTNAISPAQYAAGKKWAIWADRYQQGSIAPFPVRSGALELGIASHAPDPDSEEGQKIARREADAAERYFETLAILVDVDAERVMRRVCVDNTAPVDFLDLMKLRTGLLRLVSHWGLTGEKNHAQGRNTV